MFRSAKMCAAIALTLGLVAVGSGPVQAAPAAPAALDWQPCDGIAGFECATLTAPLDHDEPAGPQIDIKMIRQPALDPANRIGTLFWNPGGPGGAATVLATPELSLAKFFTSRFPPQAQARFDVVSFDPRGIGGSTPLSCYDSPEQREAELIAPAPPGFPFTAEEVQRQIGINARLAERCAAQGGPIQFHMSTANVARDMELMRAAVGDPKIYYYGGSYGSYLGATYANLFPDKVGRIVLDGSVPPVDWNDADAGAAVNTFGRIRSPLGNETGLQLMLTQCGEVDTSRCAFSAGTPATTAAKFQELLGRVKTEPVTVAGTTFTYAVTLATTGLLQIQNANELSGGWAGLAQVLQSVWDATEAPGDTTPPPPPTAPPASAPPTGDVGSDVNESLPEGTLGVLCGESPNPRDPASYQPQAERLNREQSPSGYGYLWTWQAAPCAEWTARDDDAYTGPFDTPTPPLLAIGTLGDPNTAYVSTPRLASQMNNVRVLTQSGGGHTALLNPSDCIDGFVEKYLIDGELPPEGTVCEQDQQPF